MITGARGERVIDHTKLDLSFVIVSWNVSDLLEKCLQSITQNTNGPTYEVIVVDNHSTDQTVPILQKKYPWVKLIANSENIGFARANNQGFCFARGKYVFILNPDTVVLPQTIEKMKIFLDMTLSAGMVGPKLLLENGAIEFTCARRKLTFNILFFFEVLRIRSMGEIGHKYAMKFLYPYDYHKTQPVDAISGASMLVRNSILQEVNGFCESFLDGGEDLYLCDKFREKGWEIWYLCDAEMIHFSGQSSKQKPVSSAINATVSKGEYLKRTNGRIYGVFYKYSIQFLDVPIMLASALCRFISGKDSRSLLDYYIQVAKGLWRWNSNDI